MNLPIINRLREEQSTYIAFSKSLMDFDKAIQYDKKCYFTKMVALNLPVWSSDKFFIDSSIMGITNQEKDPNLTIPKMIQFYLENILRQNISLDGSTPVEEIAELAFWKMLNRMGLNASDYKSTVTFFNKIAVSNFFQTETNNGWAEIVGQIPNKCQLLTPAWRTVDNVKEMVICDDTEQYIVYDSQEVKEYNFTDLKSVIDFANCTLNDTEVAEFDFNVLLLYYTDDTGIDKLHGINFIYPFEQTVTSWNLPTFKQKTNTVNTIGYQFKFNQKSVNNTASEVAVYELQENSHFNIFAETLGKLNSFLENQIGQ